MTIIAGPADVSDDGSSSSSSAASVWPWCGCPCWRYLPARVDADELEPQRLHVLQAQGSAVGGRRVPPETQLRQFAGQHLHVVRLRHAAVARLAGLQIQKEEEDLINR